jgi:transcription initiation factor TFIID subunit 15
MGKIPSTQNMVSSVFTSPQNGDDIAENQDFDISIQTSGLTAGSFTNAQTTYYSAPQDLDGNGQIIGHTHITVQDTGNSLNPTTALDPTQFAFFKGINDAGNNQGLLTATVDGGLPAGNYRICSMSSASNHQPVLMPVAQRGAQDDCIRITVGANGNNNNGNNNNGQQNNGQQNNGQQNNGQQNNGQQNNGNSEFSQLSAPSNITARSLWD